MMKLKFVKADCSDIQRLKQLWLLCFFEKEQAVDLFFSANFDNLSAYIVLDGDLIVSALYLVNTLLNGQKAHYLCGASTLPEYRNQGIMAKLIEYALNDAKKSGDVFSILFPANESLYSYYEKFGYTADCTARKAEMTRQQLTDYKYNENFLDFPFDYEQLQQKFFKNDFLLWNNKFIDFAVDYYAVYGAKSICGKGCFALIDEYDEYADVFYSAFIDFEEFKALLLNKTDAKRFVFTGKSDNCLYNNSKNEKFGMIKALDNKHNIPDDIYIGITLN